MGGTPARAPCAGAPRDGADRRRVAMFQVDGTVPSVVFDFGSHTSKVVRSVSGSFLFVPPPLSFCLRLPRGGGGGSGGWAACRVALPAGGHPTASGGWRGVDRWRLAWGTWRTWLGGGRGGEGGEDGR